MKTVTGWIPGMQQESAHGDEETAEGEEETGEEEATEEEAVALSPEERERQAMPPAMRDLPYRTVKIRTADKVILSGRLYVPGLTPESEEEEEEEAAAEEEEGAPAEPAVRYPLVMLLPGLNHTRQQWGDLPAELVKAGYAVYAVDLRGHGDSTRTTGGRLFSWRLFEQSHWDKLPQDVHTILQAFEKHPDFPQVDSHHAALIGEKLGANVAIKAGYLDKKWVKALILLNPGETYKGLNVTAEAIKYPHAVFIIAGQGDAYSFDSSEILYRIFGGKKYLMQYQAQAGSGVEMLHNVPDLKQHMLTWLKSYLPPPATPTAGPAATDAPAPEHAG